MPDGAITRVPEGFSTTAVPDRVTPSLSVGMVPTKLAVVAEVNDASVLLLMKLSVVKELMDELEMVVPESVAATAVLVTGSVAAVVDN